MGGGRVKRMAMFLRRTKTLDISSILQYVNSDNDANKQT